MANNTYGFRTALSGFHKGDVTGYIEKIASQHRSELLEYEKMVTSLREENRALQQQLNLLMEQPAPCFRTTGTPCDCNLVLNKPSCGI